MALSFIDYVYDIIARPFIYGIANNNADFLKTRLKSYLQKMFVSS